jgi:hypothetical protein
VSDTPKLPDECKKLLDNGWAIVMFSNGLGSYTAVALSRKTDNERRAIKSTAKAMKDIPENQITDDFEPSQALKRLTDKVFGLRDGGAA